MIKLNAVSKYYGRSRVRMPVLLKANATFETGQNYVVFGTRGAGKTTLLRLLSGVQTPNQGSVVRHGTVSIPAASVAMIAGEKSPRSLSMFLAPFYNADGEAVWKFVQSFCALEPELFDVPISALPTEQRMNVSYALCYGLPSDFVLFDDTISPSDARMSALCLEAFQRRRNSCGTIVTSRNTYSKEAFGDRGVIIHNGKLYFFDRISDAAQVYNDIELNIRLSSKDPGSPYARTLLAAGKSAEAKKYLEDYICANQDDIEVRELLASLLLGAGELSAATATARAVLDLDPEAAPANWILAQIAEKERRPHEAIIYAEKTLATDPQNSDAQKLLARSLERVGKHSEAAAVWRVFINPGEDSRFLRAVIRTELAAENWANALEALELAPPAKSQSEVWFIEMRVKALFGLSRVETAAETLSSYIRQDLSQSFNYLYSIATQSSLWSIVPHVLLALPTDDLNLLATHGKFKDLLTRLDVRAANELADNPNTPVITNIKKLNFFLNTPESQS